jgi:membrane-bound lytic murein transglycosylase D
MRNRLTSLLLLLHLFAFSQIEIVPDSVYVYDSAALYTPHKRVFNPEVDLVKDSPIVRALDSLAGIRFFKDYYFSSNPSMVNTYDYPADFIPTFSEEEYRQRLDAMRAESPMDFTYNRHVRDYINLYAARKRKLTQRLLGLSYLYFPMFEEMLDKYNLPLELKYLAVIESALNPVAGSRAGAKGLWQFMYGTGKVYGLKATSFIDYRFDPYLSTDAACRHLKDLYDLYEDWWLVLAAYNAGAGNVNKAIRRAGGNKNYWIIWPFLPAETRGYVPAFIAAAYVLEHAGHHNLYPLHPGILYNGIDTVAIRQAVSFDQIAEVLSLPVEDLKFLNPAYKLGIIPADQNKTYYLRLPREYIGDFINNEYQIYNYTSKTASERQKLIEQVSRAQEQVIHIVKSGESLGTIARKYKCTANDIKRWNNLKSVNLRQKQRLIIYPGFTSVESPAQSASSQPATRNESATPASTIYHTVKSGETLGKIGQKYGVSVKDLMAWNNLQNTNIRIKQKLIVASPSKEPTSSAKNGNSETKYYTVKEGDTLWDIAALFEGVTVDDIKNVNKLTSNKIRVGQKLKIQQSN